MALNDTFDDSSFLQASLQLPTDSRALVYGLICVVLGCFFIVKTSAHKTTLPYVNYDKSHWTYSEGKANFQQNAKHLIAEGFRKFSGPFNIITGNGPVIMLPPEYIEAVNAEPSLSFKQFAETENLAYLETFKNFRTPPGHIFEDAVMKGLTRSLPKFTKPLSDEMSSCLNETWTETSEWHTITLRNDVLKWVARLSCRIFLGEEMTKNEEWLHLSVDYTVNVFTAVATLKFLFPDFLIPLAEKFMPICRQVRADCAACARIIRPVIAERNKEVKAAAQEGRKPNVPDDSIEWFRASAKGRPLNEVSLQIGLAMAAIHTTSDLLTQSLINLNAHPEYVEPLRQEAIEVLTKFGWKKVALTELRLLDSFFKETQRIKPISMASMHRVATRDVELPGGVKIKKGERLGISSHRMWNEQVYEHPEVFDAYRFLNRRKNPGFENKSLLVATSNDHTAFSHGKHACPGRFFAANEVKIAMVHLLLKYDFKLVDSASTKWKEIGVQMTASDTAMLHVRRRKAEIDLDALMAD